MQLKVDLSSLAHFVWNIVTLIVLSLASIGVVLHNIHVKLESFESRLINKCSV